MMRERKGFTLIELLVVIAVIALLLAVLMPALRAAKGQGQMAACSAQLRQFGLAWSQYADDNDGFNIEYAPSSQWASGGFWFYQLGPYFSAKDFGKAETEIKTPSKTGGKIKTLSKAEAECKGPNKAGSLSKFPNEAEAESEVSSVNKGERGR